MAHVNLEMLNTERSMQFQMLLLTGYIGFNNIQNSSSWSMM